MFIGTSSGSRVEIENANSIRCLVDSPIPMIPPQHSSRPAPLTILAVLILSENSWVLQIFGKKLSEVSRLWLYLLTPNDFSLTARSVVMKPSETLTVSYTHLTLPT